MDSDQNELRFQSIYEMLFQMGKGNFAHRIQRSKIDDNLEIVTVLINMFAEEMNEFILHKGYVNPHHTNKYIVQSAFILDAYFVIKSFNSKVPAILGFKPEDIYQKYFLELLVEPSVAVFKNIENDIIENPIYHASVQLTFKTQKQLYIPVSCIILRLLHSTDILVSFVTNIIEETTLPTTLTSDKDQTKPKGIYRIADVQLIQELYDFILNNLDKPLPTIKELARIFGTNEYKLKYGFKYLFKTSIYQFYNTKRLNKAHLLIQQTTIQLKEIAVMTGFNSYPNFSKAFKKLFGYSPNEMKRML